MGQILVRKIEDDILDAVRKNAKANHRSTEAEIRAIIEESVRGREADAQKTRRKSLLELVGAAPSNRTVDEIVADIRALRDEWER